MLHLYPKFAKLEVFRGSFQADWSPKKGKTTAKKLSFWISLPGSPNRRQSSVTRSGVTYFKGISTFERTFNLRPFHALQVDPFGSLFVSSPCIRPISARFSISYRNIRLSRELFSIAHFGGLVLHFNLLSPSSVCNPSGGASTFVSNFSCLECAISNVII